MFRQLATRSNKSILKNNLNTFIIKHNHFTQRQFSTINNSLLFQQKKKNDFRPGMSPEEFFKNFEEQFKQERFISGSTSSSNRMITNPFLRFIIGLITLPFKIIGGIIKIISFIRFYRGIKGYNDVFSKMLIKDAIPISELYRVKEVDNPPTYFSRMEGQQVEIDSMLEKCLKVIDNDPVIYEKLVDISFASDSNVISNVMKESWEYADRKSKMERGENTKTHSFKDSISYKILVNLDQLQAARSSNNMYVRQIPIHIAREMRDKEKEKINELKKKVQSTLGAEFEESEATKNLKPIVDLTLAVYSMYEPRGGWTNFQKFEIVENDEVILSFDDLETVIEGAATSEILDADFKEK
ncbi:hypothetical protein ABK040_013007 [Willaertia magna]